MTKSRIDLHQHRAAHRPVPVDRDHDRNHRFRGPAQSQIHNINPVRLVVSTVNRNRNHLAMVGEAVDVQVLEQEIVDQIVRPEHGLEAVHLNEVVNIMVDVAVRICL